MLEGGSVPSLTGMVLRRLLAIIGGACSLVIRFGKWRFGGDDCRSFAWSWQICGRFVADFRIFSVSRYRLSLKTFANNCPKQQSRCENIEQEAVPGGNEHHSKLF